MQYNVNNEMRTGLEMGECLTSCGVVSRVHLRGCSRNGYEVRTYHQGMTCLQTDGDYRIKFPETNTFHKISVRNPSLLFKLIQSAHCRCLFRDTT